MKFRLLTFEKLKFKVKRNFEKDSFPLTSMVTLPKDCQKNSRDFLKICSLKMNAKNLMKIPLYIALFIYLSNDTKNDKIS